MAKDYTELALGGIEHTIANSDEIVRIFMGRGGPATYMVDAARITEPFMLGMICADLTRHGAMAFAHAKGMDPQEALEAIIAGLWAELQNPTDPIGEPN